MTADNNGAVRAAGTRAGPARAAGRAPFPPTPLANGPVSRSVIRPSSDNVPDG